MAIASDGLNGLNESFMHGLLEHLPEGSFRLEEVPELSYGLVRFVRVLLLGTKQPIMIHN